MASAFGGQRSIQLSYGCVRRGLRGGGPQRQGVRNCASASWSCFRAEPTIIPTWPDGMAMTSPRGDRLRRCDQVACGGQVECRHGQRVGDRRGRR